MNMMRDRKESVNPVSGSRQHLQHQGSPGHDADELVEARTKLDQIARGGGAEGAQPGAFTASGLSEAELAEMINGLAQRIEEIAERLKSA